MSRSAGSPAHVRTSSLCRSLGVQNDVVGPRAVSRVPWYPIACPVAEGALEASLHPALASPTERPGGHSTMTVRLSLFVLLKTCWTFSSAAIRAVVEVQYVCY